MKKILIITDAWEPQVNGVVTTMTTVVKKLKEKNFKVEVIHPGMFHTFPLPNYPEISVAWNFWDLKKKIEKFDADYMHISVEGPLGVTGRHYCLENNIPYTTCIHTKFPEYVYERFGIGLDVTKGLLKWFHNPAAKTLVNTISHKGELEQDGFTDLVLWSRGFDEKIFYPCPNGGKKKYLLYVGRVAVEKNIEEFLKMPSHLPKVVVGGGPSLKSYAKKYPDVEFVGFKKGKELADYYRDAACFVFPSLTDTFGIVLIEALACGTPLAGFNVTGPKDIVIEGVNGSLDDKNLQNAVKRALQVDRTSTFNSSKTYTWDTVAEQFINSLVPMK
jgi:glycosyltransferase involved in cell wall biosynthesis